MGITQFRMWRQVAEYLHGNHAIFEYAPAYWTITTNTLFDQSLLSVSRLLDTHSGAASVEYLLNLAESGADAFKGNGSKKVILAQVAEDRKRLDRLRSTAKPIRTKRDKVLAHLDRTRAADLNQLASMFPVDPAVVEEIFGELSEVVNTYSGFWEDSETKWDLIGGDDFKGIGRLLGMGKKAEDDEWERRFGRPRRRRVNS